MGRSGVENKTLREKLAEAFSQKPPNGAYITRGVAEREDKDLDNPEITYVCATGSLKPRGHIFGRKDGRLYWRDPPLPPLGHARKRPTIFSEAPMEANLKTVGKTG